MKIKTRRESSVKKALKYFAVALLCVVFSGIFSACAVKPDDNEDDANKQVTVASCEGIGAGGYGAMFDISIDPFDDKIFAVRCDMGGIYMSYDKGASWQRRNVLGVLSDIEFDEENEGVVWTSGSGLYKSTDHGRTFKLIFPSEEDITAHGSAYENTGEWLYTDNPDYEPTSSLSSIAVNRKSGGKNIFVAQKIQFTGNDFIRIFQTENGKDFRKFTDLPFSDYIKLEYDEAKDCLIVVTDKTVTEIDKSGNAVWSENFNLTTLVGGVIAFDSYYDRQSGENTFAFCEYAEGEHAQTACYFTDDLRNRAHYQNLVQILNQKKLKDIKGETAPHEEDYASYEYSYWNYGKQTFDWRIVNVYIANENCFYFFNSYDDPLLGANGNVEGTVNINAYLQYKNGNFKWIYGTPHTDIEDLTNESWQDWASVGPAFGMSASRQNEDRFAFSTMGTVYYTEDCKIVSQCHCTVGKDVELTAKDGNGNEQKVSKVEWGIPIRETTTNGLNVQTTYKTITDPFDKNHLLMASTDIGLIQSFNGGKSWVHSLLSWNNGKTEPMSYMYRNTCYDIEFDRERQGVVYAIWSARHDAPYYPSADFLSATGAFAISYDGGTSWTMRSIRENDNVLPYRMDVDYTKNGRDIYIATEGHGFFVTHDLGETFVEINDGIKVSSYFGADKPAIFGNEILCCKGGLFALTAPSSWAQIPDPENLDNRVFERALYKWNEGLKKFEEIKLPKEIATVRDIEYSEKEDCLYIGAIGNLKWDTHEKTGGGIYRYKDGALKQIFDDSKFVWGLGLDSKDRLYAVSFRGEVYRFTENNSRAELLIGKEDFVGELFHVLKDVSFGADDNILYVSTFGGGTYRITLKEV